MKQFLACWIVVVMTSTTGLAQSGLDRESRRAAAEHGWHLDYANALKTARDSNKPLMVVFRCVP